MKTKTRRRGDHCRCAAFRSRSRGRRYGAVEAALLPARRCRPHFEAPHFRERYGLQVLGINHTASIVASSVRRPWRSATCCRAGRVKTSPALTRATSSACSARWSRSRNSVLAVRPRRSAIAIFVGVLALVTARVLRCRSRDAGTLLVFVTRCITPEEAYARVEWKAIISYGSLLSLGVAMEHTGAAKYLAWQLVSCGRCAAALAPHGLLRLTVFLTHRCRTRRAASSSFRRHPSRAPARPQPATTLR